MKILKIQHANSSLHPERNFPGCCLLWSAINSNVLVAVVIATLGCALKCIQMLVAR